MIFDLILIAILFVLIVVLLHLGPKRSAAGFRFIFHHKEISMLSLSAVQKCNVSIQPVDVKGNPAAVDGGPLWSVSADGVVTLSPAADGLSCVISGLAPGSVQVNVTADADLGEGVRSITGTLDVTVIAAEAVGFTIQTGPVEDQ
jgi:hypothetical protein